jgi:hypothetical protein
MVFMQNMGVVVCLQNLQHALLDIVFLIVSMSSGLELIECHMYMNICSYVLISAYWFKGS